VSAHFHSARVITRAKPWLWSVIYAALCERWN